MADKYGPQKRYNEKAGIINFKMRLSKKTEQDIIDKLESAPQKATYIKRLIRENIARFKQQII